MGFRIYFSGFGSYDLSSVILGREDLRDGFLCFLDDGSNGVTLADMILRRMDVLYYLQHGLGKQEFIRRFQGFFGNLDVNLLGSYYDFIEGNKSKEILSRCNSMGDVIGYGCGGLIGGSELKSYEGEVAEKFFLHFIERELGSYLLVRGFRGGHQYPGTLFLHDFTLDGDYLTGLLYSLGADRAEEVLSRCLGGRIDQKVGTEGFVLDALRTEELVLGALRTALVLIKRHSLDVNGISSGSDRMTLVVPIDGVPKDDVMGCLVNYFIDEVFSHGFLNTIDEYKITFSRYLDDRLVLIPADRVLDACNENTLEIFGRLSDYPELLRSGDDSRVFLPSVGLGRLDKLGRDWLKLKNELGVNDLFTRGFEATDELKLALAKRNFGVGTLSKLSSGDLVTVERVISGFVRKMENSIAQHQIIEFMRSGRWFDPKDLGLGFSQIRSTKVALETGLMKLTHYSDLVQVKVGDKVSILNGETPVPEKMGGAVPVKVMGVDGVFIEGFIILLPLMDCDGRQYIGIVDRDSFFAPHEVSGDTRLGITKFLEGDLVKYFDNLDLFSTVIETASLETIWQFRRYQEKVYNLVFQTPGQGHCSNFLFGRWMPEQSFLTYAGVPENEVFRLLKRLGHDYPVTFNHVRSFGISKLNLKWMEGIEFHAWKKIMEVSIVPATEHLEGCPSRYRTIARVGNLVEYTNHAVPSGCTQSAIGFIRHLVPKAQAGNFIKGNQLDISKLQETSVDTVLKWFETLPQAHRSFPNLDLPSPLAGSTADIFSGQVVPTSLIEVVEVVLDEISIIYVPYRPPTGTMRDKSLNNNVKLNETLARRLLQRLGNEGKQIDFLGLYFHEIGQYITIPEMEGYAGRVLFNELKRVAAGDVENLMEFHFKEEYTHLKNVFIWFDPEKIDEPQGEQFTILDLRILPGQFLTHPGHIDPIFSGTRHVGGKRYLEMTSIYKNRSLFERKMHYWLEAQLRRILCRLTLDENLFYQNYTAWKKTKIGGLSNAYKGGRIDRLFSDRLILELVKRYLAPGCTLGYDLKKSKVMIRRAHDERVFRSGTFLTPVFLDDSLAVDLERDTSGGTIALANYGKLLEEAIAKIPKEDVEGMATAIPDFLAPFTFRRIKVLFENHF